MVVPDGSLESVKSQPVLDGGKGSRMVACGPIWPLMIFGGPVIWAPRLSVVVLGGSRWSAGVCDVLTCPGWWEGSRVVQGGQIWSNMVQ